MPSPRIQPIAAGGVSSFEFSFVLRCPLPQVFAAYTDTDRWCARGFADDVRWVQGNAWEEGSRIRVEISEPLAATAEQLLVHFERNRGVGYSSHLFGMTCNAHVGFSALSDQETEIHVRMELVGTSWRIFSFAIGPTIEKTTLRFFDGLKTDCEWEALQAEQRALATAADDRSSRP